MCKYQWEALPDNLLHNKGCPKCADKKSAKARMKTTVQFIEEMHKLDDNIEIIGEYNGAQKQINCRCRNHNIEFSMTPTHLLGGKTGCILCAKEKSITKRSKPFEQFIYELNKVNNAVEILEYKNSSTTVTARCKKCNNIWYPNAQVLLNSYGCPECAPKSKGEVKISKYLKNNNIEYVLHENFDNLRGVNGGKLSYDFYLPKYNLLIEFQGKQHEKSIDYFGGQKSFEIQKEHDKRKKEYALSHDYKFLEIWYYDYYKIEKNIK